jgi:hypothetical protein
MMGMVGEQEKERASGLLRSRGKEPKTFRVDRAKPTRPGVRSDSGLAASERYDRLSGVPLLSVLVRGPAAALWKAITHEFPGPIHSQSKTLSRFRKLHFLTNNSIRRFYLLHTSKPKVVRTEFF